MEKEDQQTLGCTVMDLQPALINERSRLLRLLKDEFPGGNKIAEDRNCVVMLVGSEDYERLGNLIRQLQSLIERRLPNRRSHLYIIIRDRYGQRESVFKFWKDTED